MASFFYDQSAGGTKLSGPDLEALYKRDSQNDYNVQRIRQISQAYTTPSKYFADKAEALEVAGASSATIFRQEMEKLIKNRIPAALAQTRARKMADTYNELLRADIENDFPSDLSNLALQLKYDRGEASRSGFSQPKVDVPGAASGGHKHKHRK